MNQALQEEFRAKTISAQQAAALVKSGQQVYLGCCTSYARAIVDALAARSEELEDVTIGCSNIIPPMTVLDCAHPQAFRISTYFMGYEERRALKSGRGGFLPCSFGRGGVGGLRGGLFFRLFLCFFLPLFPFRVCRVLLYSPPPPPGFPF